MQARLTDFRELTACEITGFDCTTVRPKTYLCGSHSDATRCSEHFTGLFPGRDPKLSRGVHAGHENLLESVVGDAPPQPTVGPAVPSANVGPTRCGSWVPLTTERRHGLSVRPDQNEQTAASVRTDACLPSRPDVHSTTPPRFPSFSSDPSQIAQPAGTNWDQFVGDAPPQPTVGPAVPSANVGPTRCGSWVPLTTERRHGLSVRPDQNEQTAASVRTDACLPSRPDVHSTTPPRFPSFSSDPSQIAQPAGTNWDQFVGDAPPQPTVGPAVPSENMGPNPLTTERPHGLSVRPDQNEQTAASVRAVDPARGLILTDIRPGSDTAKCLLTPLPRPDACLLPPSTHGLAVAMFPVGPVHLKVVRGLRGLVFFGDPAHLYHVAVVHHRRSRDSPAPSCRPF